MENLEQNQNQVVNSSQNNDEGAKTYTQEEVDKLLQAESDRRVTEALKKAERKNADKVKEAQKLAAMNEQQKYEYQLEQREKAIAEKEKALALMENKNEASKILAEKGISLELVDFIVADDADTMNANIKLLEKAFKASVKAEVEKRLNGKSVAAGADSDALTSEEFKKLSLMEQQKLFKENPELYNSFYK